MFKRAMYLQISMLIGLFVLVLCTNFLLLFLGSKTEAVKNLDQKLAYVAELTDATLHGAELHSQLVPADFSETKELELAAELQMLAELNDVIYIYSVVLEDGATDSRGLKFITSNPTPEEQSGAPYERVYWSVYPDAPPNLFLALTSKTVYYSEYRDRWGEFRSIFVPKVAKDGRAYAWGVDVKQQDVAAIMRASLVTASKQTILFFAMALPFLVIALRASRQAWTDRERHFFYDPLTGLGGKNALEADLKLCSRPNLVLINIDRFREINSVHGHAEGDELLRAYAYNLANYQHNDLAEHKAYRIHADEFAVLADTDLPFETRSDIFTDFFKSVTSLKYRMPNGELISLTAKFGLAVGAVDDLCTRAEMALGKARESNQSIVMFDQQDDLVRHYRRSREESECVRQAILADRIVPFFHPIVNSKTGEIEKYEVLARLVNQNGDVLLLPDVFIPILKRDRLYHRFTKSIFKQSLEVSKREGVDISINISTQDILSEHKFEQLIKMIQHSGVAERVHIEFLECDSLVSLESIIAAIKKLHKIGCRVGLDDLGKGYSNFDRLTALPIDFVKLDRSVMPNIASSIEVMRIAEEILMFAKQKQITTVAEYCSDKYLCSAARHMGIDFVQGFYLAEPSQTIIKKVPEF